MKWGAALLGPARVLLACSFVPCSFAGDVQYVIAKGTDFSAYKTYEWLPTRALTRKGVVEDEPTITPAVKEAVNRQLTARGLKEVASGGDLQVATTILTESSAQLEAVVFLGGVYPYDFGTGPVTTVGRYNKHGTLVVNLIDSRTKKSAFAGMASKAIDNKPGGGLDKIPKATADIFKKYPAGKK